ncbi:MAG: FtsW/RodA/SpoVE family cell cycle protein [Bacteroidales bacterium]|nr:FtsW/RodA/SpoVE family cell cycle protein [Bacteroidales bacterium]
MPELQIQRTIDGQPVASDTEMRKAALQGKRLLRSDRYLWGIYIMLLIFSVIELYSASSTEVKDDNVYSPLVTHVTFLALGLGLVLLFQNIHYKYFRKCAWAFMFLSVGLVIYATLFGVNINGAMRAIRFAGITIQPPEIAKLAVVLVLAKVMSKHQMRHGVDNRGIIISLAIIGLFAVLLYKNGFTNTALLGIVGYTMLIIGGTQWRKMGVVTLLILVVAAVVYFAKFSDHSDADAATGTADLVAQVEQKDPKNVNRDGLRKGRISAFLEGVNPDDPVNDENRQVIFAKIAQAHGGVLGNGPGNSRESARLPLAFSDYIYSIIVEDTGFVGGIILLVLYLCLVARAGIIAAKCRKAFPALLIMGCAALIVTQALIHMFIVTGLMPVSGQPLPFISKGGTSIIVMSAAMGMMLSVSKYAVQERKKGDENARLKEQLDDGGDANINPTQLTYSSLDE